MAGSEVTLQDLLYPPGAGVQQQMPASRVLQARWSPCCRPILRGMTPGLTPAHPTWSQALTPTELGQWSWASVQKVRGPDTLRPPPPGTRAVFAPGIWTQSRWPSAHGEMRGARGTLVHLACFPPVPEDAAEMAQETGFQMPSERFGESRSLSPAQPPSPAVEPAAEGTGPSRPVVSCCVCACVCVYMCA